MPRTVQPGESVVSWPGRLWRSLPRNPYNYPKPESRTLSPNPKPKSIIHGTPHRSCLLEVSRREAWDRPFLAQCLLLPQDEHWEAW